MGFYIVFICPFVNALCTLENYRRNGHKKLHPDLSSSQGAVLVFSFFKTAFFCVCLPQSKIQQNSASQKALPLFVVRRSFSALLKGFRSF